MRLNHVHFQCEKVDGEGNHWGIKISFSVYFNVLAPTSATFKTIL